MKRLDHQEEGIYFNWNLTIMITICARLNQHYFPTHQLEKGGFCLFS